jgi:hypothetical protein
MQGGGCRGICVHSFGDPTSVAHAVRLHQNALYSFLSYKLFNINLQTESQLKPSKHPFICIKFVLRDTWESTRCSNVRYSTC